MSEKHLISSEDSPAVNRFDNLLSLISKDQTGWVELPERSIHSCTEAIPARIFAFNPKELPEDYESEYSPRLYIELGERTYKEDGKPIGEVIKFGIKRAQLETDANDNELAQKAEQELDIIEELLFAYQNGRYQ